MKFFTLPFPLANPMGSAGVGKATPISNFSSLVCTRLYYKTVPQFSKNFPCGPRKIYKMRAARGSITHMIAIIIPFVIIYVIQMINIFLEIILVHANIEVGFRTMYDFHNSTDTLKF